MKKQVRLLILCFLPYLGLHAQTGVYVEKGFNAMGTMNFEHSPHSEVKSHKILFPKSHFEVGLKQDLSKRSAVYVGISDNTYAFMNDHYLPQVDSELHIRDLFEYDYFGANLGLDYDIIDYDVWDVFVSGEISGNFLSSAVRKYKVMNADPSVLSKDISDLMFDSNHKKLWFTVQFGLALERRVSDLASVYAQYNFTESLTGIEHQHESYDFNSHTFSVGLLLNIGAYGKNNSNQ